jgi:hypothetical protein
MRVYVYEPWRQVDGLPPVLYSKEIDDPQPRLMVQPPLPLPATIPSPPPDTVPGWGYTSEIGVLSPPPALPLPTPGVTVDQALPWRADYGYPYPGVAGPVYASTPWSNCGCNSCSELRRRRRAGSTDGSIDSINMDLTVNVEVAAPPLTGIDVTDTSGIPSTIPVSPPAQVSTETAEALRTELQVYNGMPNTTETRNAIARDTSDWLALTRADWLALTRADWLARTRPQEPPTPPREDATFEADLRYSLDMAAAAMDLARSMAVPSPPSPVELELKTYTHKKAGKIVYVYQPVGMLSKGALTMAMATELALDAQKEAQ